jgi:hypothetical protein
MIKETTVKMVVKTTATATTATIVVATATRILQLIIIRQTMGIIMEPQMLIKRLQVTKATTRTKIKTDY